MRLVVRPHGGSAGRPDVLCLPLLFLSLAVLLFLFPGASAHSRQRNPLRSLSHVEDAVIHTPGHRVDALSSFHLSLTLRQLDGGRRRQLPVRLHLWPNDDILAEDAMIQQRNADGSVTIEPIRRRDHRVFRGDVFVSTDGSRGRGSWTQAGWASIYVYEDGAQPVFEGAFRVFGDDHHVQTREHYAATGVWGDPLVPVLSEAAMVVWRDSDVMTEAAAMPTELRRRWLEDGVDMSDAEVCSADGLVFNRDVDQSTWLFGRQIDGTGSTGGNSAGVNLTTTIGSTSGCPTTRKVALMGIAADCTYAAAFTSRENATSNIVQQVGTASQVYEDTFNISLAIKSLVMENDTCPASAAAAASTATAWNADCSSGLTITDRLNLFSQWRGTQDDSNAFWMLLSTCNTDAAVGLAWLGQLCMPGASTSADSNETVAAANVVVRTSTEWQVMAHETGHTFGAVHDCTSTTCSDGTVSTQQCCPLSATTCDADGQYLMNPSTGSGITAFSPCTVGNVCSALGRNSVNGTCLSDNRDVATYTNSSVCGNGIVESGEDCDCGGDAGCASSSANCCDPDTCTFVDGAVCDPANDACCTNSCQVASLGTVCRASTGSCDPAESCDGSSAVCPADVTADDGTACTDTSTNLTGLACASGQCTSRDEQCQAVLGTGVSACSSDSGCTLTCATSGSSSSSFFSTSETCVLLYQNFLDGTPCASGAGTCSNGDCANVSVGKEVVSTLRKNLNIVIPVAVVIGVLILAALLGCVRTMLRRRRWRQQQALYRQQRAGGMPGGMPGGPAIPMTAAAAWAGQGHGHRGNRLSRAAAVPKPANAMPPEQHPGWSFWKTNRGGDRSSASFGNGPSAAMHVSPPPGPPPSHGAQPFFAPPGNYASPPPPYSPPQNPPSARFA